MQEWTQREALDYASQADSAFAVFVYTPLCGTCKLAERMLAIILTMEPELPVFKANINFMPQVSREWQIGSVPCLIIVEPGGRKQMMYQMKSVDELYARLRVLSKRNKQEEDRE